MTSSIFIKTYQPDLKWLEWSLKFLERNWQDWDSTELVICCPQDCVETIKSWESPMKPRFFTVPEWTDGYLGQQYRKMMADTYCEGDYITFIDSDAMLVEPTHLDDLFGAAGPTVYYTPYGPEVGDANCWKPIVASVMHLDPKYEFMRRLPLTYARDTLDACRWHLQRLHGMTLENIFYCQRPRHFSEFNVIGFYAWVFERDCYDFRNTDLGFPPGRVRQFWSYGDWTDDCPRYFREVLSGLDKLEAASQKLLPKDQAKAILDAARGW